VLADWSADDLRQLARLLRQLADNLTQGLGKP